MVNFSLSILSALLIVPAAALCVLPMQDSVVGGRNRMLLYVGLFCIGYVLAEQVVRYVLPVQLPEGTQLLILMASGMLLGQNLVRVPRERLLFVIVDVTAIMTNTRSISRLVECALSSTGSANQLTVEGVAVQWGATVVMLLLFSHFLRNQLSWVILHYEDKKSWITACVIPLVLAGSNLFIMPRYNETLSVNRTMAVFAMLVLVMLFATAAFNLFFYQMAQSSDQNVRLSKQMQILEMQANQYKALKQHIEVTKQLRHDYRHAMRLLLELLDAGKTDEMRSYLESYSQRIEKGSLEIFCENPAVNAVVAYYNDIARQEEIRVRWEVTVPDTLPMAEVDLCSLLGNALENAVAASTKLPKRERFLALTVEVNSGREVLISVTNRFDGTVRIENGIYRSTAHKGEGLGLQSIRAVVQRYHGQMQVHHEGRLFCLDVYLAV